MHQRGACLRAALQKQWQIVRNELVVGVQHADVPVARHPHRQVAQPWETEVTLQEHRFQRRVLVENLDRPQELLRSVAGGIVDDQELSKVTSLLEALDRLEGAAYRPGKIRSMVPVRNKYSYAVLCLAILVERAQARVGEDSGLYTICALQYLGLRQDVTPRTNVPPTVLWRRRSLWHDDTFHYTLCPAPPYRSPRRKRRRREHLTLQG